MKLKNDICRCNGSNCGETDTCERYLQRETGGERTPVADTLWDGIAYPLWCPMKIEKGESE